MLCFPKVCHILIRLSHSSSGCQNLLCRQNEAPSFEPINNSTQWPTCFPSISPFQQIHLSLSTHMAINIWARHANAWQTNGQRQRESSSYKPSHLSVNAAFLISHHQFAPPDSAYVTKVLIIRPAICGTQLTWFHPLSAWNCAGRRKNN